MAGQLTTWRSGETAGVVLAPRPSRETKTNWRSQMRMVSPDWSAVGQAILAPLRNVPFLEAVSCNSQPRWVCMRIAQWRREMKQSATTTSLSEERPTVLRPTFKG